MSAHLAECFQNGSRKPKAGLESIALSLGERTLSELEFKSAELE